MLLIFREHGVRNGEPHFRSLLETSSELKIEEWQKPQYILFEWDFVFVEGRVEEWRTSFPLLYVFAKCYS
ncbi:hypothetical protein [Methanosarcina sp. UBA411]|uniref:hypothetical protein n=1 Tax=Methanosarcina sp. UBA411 TaxID=1915589 RepID=UPI0025E620E3|nr:hypothetical protein [Methanosarcina sp. UBA411]